MKILIFGSGVIGCIYASRLHEMQHNVSLLARGQRYQDLKRNGLIVRNIVTGQQTISSVPLIQTLGAADFYDLIIVAVRFDQLDAVIPVLQQNSVCPLILFMLNNPGDTAHLTGLLAPKHIILGFPGAGGTYRDNFIDYIQIKQQKTTLGEVEGKNSGYLDKIKTILENAKFEVEICNNMQAWLKTHAVFISCIAAAIIAANGDSVQLSRKRSSVLAMVRSIREGFFACRALGMPVEPANLKTIFMTMPVWFSVLYWQCALKGKLGTLAMAPHANAAKDEMQLLAKKVMTLVHTSVIPTPTLDKLLLSFI